MKNVIEIKDLSYSYENTNVLENISLDVQRGSFLALVGPNGSGKSTLLKCLLGVLEYKEGSITLFGKDQKKFNHWDWIGYVSQKANSFNTGFPATVTEVVLSGLTTKVGLFKRFSKLDRERALQAIQSVGMEKFVNRNIGELSGGQQQRVFIARALVSNPKLLILDEPTVGVDAKNVADFYEMLRVLNEEKGITLIMVTHDIGGITDKVTQVACLNKYLHFHGNTEQYAALQDKDMSAMYGHSIHVHTHNHDHHHHGGHE